MASVEVREADGTSAGTVELPADVFDVQANLSLMHQVVVAQQAAARQGTHDTKTRGEVSGGGKKPYRQKGTGRARQGSTRAPQFAGGGVVHGPTPRDYSQRTPKKMKAAALRGALSDRARAGRVHVVSSFADGDSPSTRTAIAALAAVTDARKVLVVLDRDRRAQLASLRNVKSVHLLEEGQLNTYDVLVSDDVVFTRAALDAFLARSGRGGGRRALPDLSTPDIPGASVPSVAPAEGAGTVDDRHGHRGGGRVIADPRDVLLAPVISEKSYGLLDENKYTFVVRPDANKTQIKIAVEQVFNVRVLDVNTLNRQGKRKRTRSGFGRRKDTKRAIVSLAPGDRIEIFGGPVS